MKNKLIAFVLFLSACSGKKNTSEQFSRLYGFFGTANWRVIHGSDTSYIFFSDQADKTYKTYQYTIFKGDSSHTEMGSIAPGPDEMNWKLLNRQLTLSRLDPNLAIWNDQQGEYRLQKQNDSLLQMNMPDGKLIFEKTLPLSTFLVRAKYDFEHNSNLIDSLEIRSTRLIRY